MITLSQMITTDKLSCTVLADLLAAHGVKDIIASPGSRNAPLIIALKRCNNFNLRMVIDERSAAFIAMGLSLQSGNPVAVVCTSGSALLNYAPAVAEAYYRAVPLIVISADRPEEWIDQDDSQTINQEGVLASIVKRSYNIDAHLSHPNGRWICERTINDALIEALSQRKGPVHINVRLDAPLSRMIDFDEKDHFRLIRRLKSSEDIPVAEARKLGESLASPKKIMIVTGFLEPNSSLNRSLAKLAALPNFIVFTESISNLHSPLFITRIDNTLAALTADERETLKPDVVITLGGALVSRHIKEWLRGLKNVEHWHIGHSHTTVDCFRMLTLRVDILPETFMRQLASAMQIHRTPSDYAEAWRSVSRRGAFRLRDYIVSVPWSDLKAFSIIIPSIPTKWNLHLSNGTSVRYAQLFDCSKIHRCDCNRGVSGIDGSTSTALGASLAYKDVTLLISGDMSFQYDLAALSSNLLSPRFKMIVICNGGGEIFRIIGSTSSLPELDENFTMGTNLPLQKISEAYNIRYFQASSESSLIDSFKKFMDCKDPALLAVYTSGEESAKVLRQFFELR